MSRRSCSSTSPNTGLDPIMTDIIDEVILEMREKMNPTIVTITHHMESARKIGDRVALLYGGKILYDAPPEEFLQASDPAVRQFVGGKREGAVDGRVSRCRRAHELPRQKSERFSSWS